MRPVFAITHSWLLFQSVYLTVCPLLSSFEPDGDITDRTARAAKGEKRRSELRTKERGKKPGR